MKSMTLIICANKQNWPGNNLRIKEKKLIYQK